MKKLFLIGLPMAIVLSGFIAYQFLNKKTNDIANIKAERSVDAKTLVITFNKDTSVAKKQFLNKILKVAGKIKRIDPAGAVVLEGPEEESSVVCGLDPRHIADIKQLSEGSTIVLQGLCTAYEVGEEMLGVNLGTTIQLAFAGIKKP